MAKGEKGRCYIIGDIISDEYDATVELFARVAVSVSRRGYIAVNPFEIGVLDDPHWADYVAAQLAVLTRCHSVYVIGGWERSSSAALQHALAKKLGLEIIYEEGQP